jgi:uncharacterized membrane protein
MVDITTSPLDNSVTQGSQSSVSGGEIQSAFGALAAGMDELGQTFENAAVEKAGLEGQGAVYRGEDGKLRYDSRNPLSRAGTAFNRSAQTAFVSQVSMEARPAIANLEMEAKGNVAEFDKLSAAYTKQLLKGKDPLIKGPIQNEVMGLINSSRNGMIRAQQNRDIQMQSDSISARIKMANEDAAALARSGGTGTAEYAEQLDIIRTLEKEKVGNPLFAYSQAESDVFLRGVEGFHMAEAIVGQVEGIYQSKGLKAAQDFAYKSFDDPKLGLSPAERRTFKNAALGALTQFKAEVAIDRSEAREDAKILKESIVGGQAVNDEDVYAVADRLSKAGDVGGALRLMREHSTSKQIAYFSQLPDAEQAAALGTGSLGGVQTFVSNIIGAESGNDPNAKNPNSTASGVGQFLDETWLRVVRQYRPDVAAGKSDGEILALKGERGLGTEMVGHFAEENARALTTAGFVASAGNIYLAHFLGVGGAKKVLGSDARTSVASIVGEKVMAANPFLAGMNVADIRAWSNRKMGGPSIDGKTYAAMRKEVAGDARALWSNMKAGMSKGDPLNQADLDLLGTQLAGVGDKDFSDEVMGYLKQTGDYSSSTLASMKKQMQDIEAGGVASDERDTLDMMRAVHDQTVKGLAEDPLEHGRRIGMEGVKDIAPIDFSTPAALGAGLGKNIQAARIVAQRYGTTDVGVLTKADALQFKNIVAGGDVQQAATAMQALAEVPDEMLRGTFNMPDVRDALLGASQSRDFDRYGAAMTVMDKLYNRAPQEFAQIFKGSALEALQDWQGRLRYFNPEELQAEFKRRGDPQYAARQEVLKREGSTTARKVKVVDISADLGGPAPTDNLISSAMQADYESLFAARFAATQDVHTANVQTIERMKQHWGPSATNNGELMLHPPDHYYPAIEGSHDWINNQLQADLVAAGFVHETERQPMGKGAQVTTQKQAWPHMLIADAVTEAEAAAGKMPSYRVVVTNPNTGLSDYAMGPDGKELSVRFDSAPDLAKANQKYAEQRKRFLDQRQGLKDRQNIRRQRLEKRLGTIQPGGLF